MHSPSVQSQHRLKGKQGTAHKEVAAFFANANANDSRDVEHTFHETVDGSEHGRLEVRRVWALQDLGWFADPSKWKNLSSIIMIESEWTVGAEISLERRYYWSSRRVGTETFAAMIHGHWSIENERHWYLDVGFREDESRIRADHGTETAEARMLERSLSSQAPAGGIARNSS